MSLVLKVTSMGNQIPQNPIEFEFEEKGGAIGRKPSNDWILPDEQRHLSGSHASIEYEDGSYYIVDTSTNGVFVNGSDKSLGKGNKQQLEDGFNLLMGTFNIEVVLINSNPSINNMSDELFTDATTGADSSDDLFSDLFDDPVKSVDDSFFESLDPVEKKSSVSIGSDDPFFDFDEFNTGSSNKIPKKESKLEHNDSEMDSFFKPAEVDRFTQIDDPNKEVKDSSIIKDKENSIFEVDNSNQGIPDDWDFGSNSDSSIDDFFTDIDDSLKVTDKKDDPFINDKKKETDNVLQKNTFIPNEINQNLSSSSSNAFFKGLGIDDDSFNDDLSEQQLFLAGKLFRTAIKGTIDVLHSRAEIKNEMRMDMTTIQPIQNNPIKFAVDVNEAIKKLLSQDNKSYMDPEQAMNEVYDDITSHQLAIISGIQASLSHVLKRFEPKNLITRFEKDSPISASIPVHRKAKLWDAFENLYDAIETEAEDDFNRLFGEEFAKAYDQQVEMLKKKRTK